ncbi:MAG: leucine-rich repeat domain-containing protein [Cyclobacteriaceae bacterium]|nr:leucine-rich repeat domain-containing protein [Cyclobacteriaceae bacterium]
MNRALFTLIFLLGFYTLPAQQRVPVFASRSDSAAYWQTIDRLTDAMRNPRYTFRIDSLSKVMASLRDKAVRYRTEYRPSPLYINYSKRPSDASTVTRVSLVDYKGKELPDSLFLLTNLKELELINTRIRKLPARLEELKSLEKISLLNNRPKGRMVLHKSERIKSLVIHDDEIDRRPRSFRKYSHLESLDLSRCNLDRFPKLKGIPRLKRLLLTENRLQLNELKRGMPGLEELVLTSNSIRAVPPAIGEFTSLKKLNLNANQVEQLAPEMGKLQQLEQLSLYKNNLKALPKELYGLSSLRVIDLYYNQLEELDPAILNWTQLEILYLANNRLFTLPETLGHLKNLRELYLHHNRLSNLPASLGQLDSLRVFRVNNNNLVEFPASLLRLSALENLDLASNSLTSLPEALFDYPHLQILSIKGNPLEPAARTQALEWARKAMQKRPLMIHFEGLMEPNDPVENK